MSCFGSFDAFLITLGVRADHEEKEVVQQAEPVKKKRSFFRRRRIKKSSNENKTSRGLFLRRSKSDATVSSVSTVSSEGTDHHLETGNELQKRFPASTRQERKRFLTGRSLVRATEKMDYYIKWRQQYQLDSKSFRQHPSFGSDEEAWDFAVDHASKYYNGGSVQSGLPRIVKFSHDKKLIAKDKKRIAQVLPGLIDKRLAPLDFYALCVAVYLDLTFDRNSDESIYVLVDVRAGVNWPNPSPTALMPFVKSLTKNLADNMPERMSKTYVYPIPAVAKPVWAIYKAFLDPKLVKKIKVLWGPASANSPIPSQMMKNGTFTESIIDQLEDSRFSEFKYG